MAGAALDGAHFASMPQFTQWEPLRLPADGGLRDGDDGDGADDGNGDDVVSAAVKDATKQGPAPSRGSWGGVAFNATL